MINIKKEPTMKRNKAIAWGEKLSSASLIPINAEDQKMTVKPIAIHASIKTSLFVTNDDQV